MHLFECLSLQLGQPWCGPITDPDIEALTRSILGPPNRPSQMNPADPCRSGSGTGSCLPDGSDQRSAERLVGCLGLYSHHLVGRERCFF